MTPEERVDAIIAEGMDLPFSDLKAMGDTMISSIREAVAEERETCARLAEAQAEDIGNELPNGSGGAWAKRFGRNVALSIVGAIRTRANTETA